MVENSWGFDDNCDVLPPCHETGMAFRKAHVRSTEKSENRDGEYWSAMGSLTLGALTWVSAPVGGILVLKRLFDMRAFHVPDRRTFKEPSQIRRSPSASRRRVVHFRRSCQTCLAKQRPVSCRTARDKTKVWPSVLPSQTQEWHTTSYGAFLSADTFVCNWFFFSNFTYTRHVQAPKSLWLHTLRDCEFNDTYARHKKKPSLNWHHCLALYLQTFTKAEQFATTFFHHKLPVQLLRLNINFWKVFQTLKRRFHKALPSKAHKTPIWASEQW